MISLDFKRTIDNHCLDPEILAKIENELETTEGPAWCSGDERVSPWKA